MRRGGGMWGRHATVSVTIRMTPGLYNWMAMLGEYAGYKEPRLFIRYLAVMGAREEQKRRSLLRLMRSFTR